MVKRRNDVIIAGALEAIDTIRVDVIVPASPSLTITHTSKSNPYQTCSTFEIECLISPPYLQIRNLQPDSIS